MANTLTLSLACWGVISPARALVGPQERFPWGAYLHWSTSLWASCLLLIMGGTMPQAPASSARLMRAGVLSATLTIGKQAGNFYNRCKHSNDVRSSNRPCCWSMRTTPRPAFAKCSLTMGSATFWNTPTKGGLRLLWTFESLDNMVISWRRERDWPH